MIQESHPCILRESLYNAVHHSNLIVFLDRKDTQGFFAYPVNDTIAPGYSNIITHPMDFSSMKFKIDSNEYHSLERFRVSQANMIYPTNGGWLYSVSF